MSDDTRERAHQIATQAMGQSPQVRGRFVRDACGADSELRRLVDERIAEVVLGGTLAIEMKPQCFLPTQAPSLDVGTVRFGGVGELPGEDLGPYTLIQLIGEGGFGTVYMAEQHSPVKRHVAIKLLKPGFESGQVVARFEAERQALAMMDHPGIAKVFDAGTTSAGRPFFAMELVRGDPITTYCDAKLLGLRERLDLFRAVCSAVQHAHHKGVIHRDIKPSNVLVAETDGVALPKVIDFGIAKALHARLTDGTLMTEARQMLGTPEYMSPEQASGTSLDIDTRSDVYSLGALLYELLTGSTPFDSLRLRSAAYGEIQRIVREVEPAAPSTRLATQVRQRPVTVLGGASSAAHSLDVGEVARRRGTSAAMLIRGVRGELDWIVMKALEKDRSRRYESAAAFAADIERYIQNEPVLARAPSAAYRVRKFVSRHRVGMTAVGAVFVSLVAGLAASVAGFVSARTERDRAIESGKREAAARAVAESSVSYAEEAERFFLRQIMASAEPDTAAGRNISVQEIVDGAGESAWKIREPRVQAAVRERVGAVYLSLGRWDAGLKQLQEALSIRERSDGPNAPATTRARFEHARGLAAVGNNEHAASEFTRVVQELSSQMGPQHPRVAVARHQLADVLVRLGREQEASDQEKQALAVLRQTGESEYAVDLAQSLNGAAVAAGKQGDARGAVRLFEESLTAQESAPAASMTLRATTLTLMADALLNLNSIDEAVAGLNEALEIRMRIYPAGHDAIAQSRTVLAQALVKQGDFAAAESEARAALAIYKESRGEEHEYVATSLHQLGTVLSKAGRCADALASFDRAIAVYTRVFSESDWRTCNSRVSRGACLVSLHRFEEAERELLDAHRMLLSSNQVPAAVKNARVQLVTLYDTWGKPEKAGAWRDQ